MCIYNYNNFNYNHVNEESYLILRQIFKSIDENNFNNVQSLTKDLIKIEKNNGNSNVKFLEDYLNNLN